ncbi:MAG: hypothetical protein M1813_003065 [Trichoglossum hirsutum]|nr:MAG: hypothetical protein M1813_003065 [Trichoglossum hirsutum]
MSSRALRKAQRQIKAESGHRPEQDADSEAEAGEHDAIATQNLFAMLGVEDEEEEAQDEPEDEPADEQTTGNTDLTKHPIPKPKNKRKRKGKSKATASTGEYLDEIDMALHSLALRNATTTGSPGQGPTELVRDSEHLYKLISIDTQNLNAANEMRRLFGRASLDTDGGNNRAIAGGGRGRGRGDGHAGAAAGQQARRAGFGLRKNVFIQGKDTWPQATAGGLGMEIVEKREDGTAEYKFVHNVAYRDVQRQFFMCVESLDPERMIQLLAHNPYHISTLLQVHEIAATERDYPTAGDLLERALFSLGRSSHSTFAANLAQGRVRLDFRRVENRELWLAAWRYIKSLGRRGTWRTAFEWSKLLLGLSPQEDPYCVGLVIDQLSLRAGQGKELLDLAENPVFASQWIDHPNMAFSVALAHGQLKQAEPARSALVSAIQKFPWVVPRLLKELNVERIPPKLWGLEPPTQPDRLLTELYAVRSKDIWNTPEAISLLMEVAEEISKMNDLSPSPRWDSIITVNQARHVLLDDTPAFISLLPKHFLDPATSPLDPFPPADNISQYTAAANPGLAHQDVEIAREL